MGTPIEFLHALTSIFFGLLLVVVMAAGFVMMFRPELARRLLKNAGISLLIFVLGTMLLQSFCSTLRHPKQ